MIELIQKWLQNKSYPIGVEIYRRYGDDDYLKKMFSLGEDSYNTQRLEKEIKSLLKVGAHSESPSTTAKVIYESQLVDELTKPSLKSKAPAEVKSIISKRKKLYAKTVVNKDKLVELYLEGSENKELASTLAHQILDCYDEIKPLWDYTNFYDKHQRLPNIIVPKTNYQDYSDVDLNRMFLNNSKYISKNRSVTRKKQTVEDRIAECYHIKTLLIKRDAFQHQGINIPTVEELNNSNY